MTIQPSRRAYALAVFLILLVCYGYFMPKWADWGANSRADLVYAIGDQGVLNIDDYHENTGDKACFPGPYEDNTETCNGHYYTDKSIGPSLLALPFYIIFKGVAALPPVQTIIERGASLGNFSDTLNPEGQGFRPEAMYEGMALTFMTFFASSVPAAILGAVFFLFAARFARKDSYAFTLALIFGLATPAFAYSNVLYQHQLAAFGAFVGFFLLWRVIYEGANLRWLWVVGVLFGLVAITEYPVVPFVGLIFLWAVYKLPNRVALYRVVLGAIPLGLLFAAYNMAIFQTPLPVGYEYSTEWQGVHTQGFLSITTPDWKSFIGLTVTPFRGLFFISPILLLVLPGVVLMWQTRKEYRSVTVLLFLIIAGFLLYNSSSVMWWGGHSIGPRYLVPMIPFMALPIIFALNQLLRSPINRLVIVLLVGASLFNVWAQTIGGQAFPPAILDDGTEIRNPLMEYSIPMLLQGNIARNYGIFLGLPGFLSLLPLLVAIVGIYFVVPRWVDRSTRMQHNTKPLEQAASGNP
jgi:hypothetical protein